jgi:hypothetical protein
LKNPERWTKLRAWPQTGFAVTSRRVLNLKTELKTLPERCLALWPANSFLHPLKSDQAGLYFSRPMRLRREAKAAHCGCPIASPAQKIFTRRFHFTHHSTVVFQTVCVYPRAQRSPAFLTDVIQADCGPDRLGVFPAKRKAAVMHACLHIPDREHSQTDEDGAHDRT